MSILSAHRMPESGGGDFNLDGTRTYREKWQVITDSLAHREDEIAASTVDSKPVLGDVHPSNSSAICQSIHCDRDSKQPKLWVLVIEYTYQPSTGDWEGQNGSLELILPEIEIFDIPFTRPAERQIAEWGGDPILNSAQRPYEKAYEQDDWRTGVRITRYELSSPTAPANGLYRSRLYRNAINLDPLWQGKPYEVSPAQAKIQSISGPRVVAYGAVYYKNTYTLHITNADWYLTLLDRGYYELNAAGDGVVRILDAQGKPVDQPALLDGHGAVLPQGADGFWKAWHVYPEKELAPLNLPDLEFTL